MIRFINSKKPKDKLTREDLPTNLEVRKILSACADSTRDKAMIAVHAEAGTRIGELFGMKIKDLVLDNNGGIIAVVVIGIKKHLAPINWKSSLLSFQSDNLFLNIVNKFLLVYKDIMSN